MVTRAMTEQPPPFSRVDGLAILVAAVAAVLWIVWPQAMGTGFLLMTAGVANLFRLGRWRGWVMWHEPLVLILHVGYGWLALSLLLLGGATLGLGVQTADAVHALTTGAGGAMTLAIMTRASLGHTGRPLHAGSATVLIYVLVNLGALLRVFGPATGISTSLMLGLAGGCWSSAYLLFALLYGPLLIPASTNNGPLLQFLYRFRQLSLALLEWKN